MIVQGIRTNTAKNPSIFVIFQWAPYLFPLGPCMLTINFGFFFLRFSEDIVEDIQKEMDAMMQDIKTDKGLVVETANVGKVPYFFSLKSTPYRVQ